MTPDEILKGACFPDAETRAAVVARVEAAYQAGYEAAEAKLHASIKGALGAHIIADAYRDTFPDDAADAAQLRKQETYWRLMARSWLGDDLEEECHQVAKARALQPLPAPPKEQG